MTTLGLVVVIFWGLQTAPTITRTLDEGLGKQWRTAIDPTLAARVLLRFAASVLLEPFAIRRWNVEHVTNISYGEAGKYHPLDLYRQRSRLTNAPVLIHFHGGAFVGGKNHDGLPLFYRLASHGWVCISANYRIGFAVTLTEQVSDARWVHCLGASARPLPYFCYTRDMTIKRLDHVSVVVDDLAAAIAFFTTLGMESEGEALVEGPWVDRVNGLEGIQVDIVMMRTPDGHGQLELTKFRHPQLVESTPSIAPPNTLGLRSVMFTVESVDDTVARLRATGAELIGEVAQYEDMYRLCYMRGPAGIIVALAEEL